MEDVRGLQGAEQMQIVKDCYPLPWIDLLLDTSGPSQGLQ